MASRGDADGGVEAEGAVGRGDVVVDRLRDADDGQARVGQHAGRGQRAFAADRDEDVEADLLGELLRVLAGRAELVALQAGTDPRWCRRGRGCR